MRCVLLDLDGVVVQGFHSDPARRKHWDESLHADLGIDPLALTERFFKGIFAREVIPGRIPLVTALAAVLPELGFKDSPLRLIDYWLSRDSKLDRELLEAVTLLRTTGTPTFLLTNQEHLRVFHIWTVLSLKNHFDDILYSARLGAAKPATDFFEAAAALLPPFVEQPLFFDDSVANVDAARHLGWEAVLYDGIADFRGHPWIAARLGLAQGSGAAIE
jgi:putative hydrolase of the HAD superfamily